MPPALVSCLLFAYNLDFCCRSRVGTRQQLYNIIDVYLLLFSAEPIASDRCQLEKRKTINGEDILWAMQSLGFENYGEALKIYLAKYRETMKIERQAATGSKDKEGEEDIKQDESALYQQQGVNAGYYQ
ncbi:unnamed protein product [Mortierella alpina]